MMTGSPVERAASFEDWFRDLLPLARRCAARAHASGDDSDDLVAEAFARALNRWPAVSVLPYRDAWLMRVLINLSLDAARKRKRHPPRRQEPEDEADQIATRLTMATALGSLPRRQREAISLRYLADLTEADVSEALGVSQNTVKRHLSRGRTALRSQLGTEWDKET